MRVSERDPPAALMHAIVFGAPGSHMQPEIFSRTLQYTAKYLRELLPCVRIE
jgi:hypothetical protein